MKLSNKTIHIHKIDLSEENYDREKFDNILSSEEKQRAERFVYEKDRRRFIIARSSLRITLGQYLNRSPQRISFEYTSNGKPSIKNNLKNNLNFNMSHSFNTAVLALCTNRAIGIDIEYYRKLKDFEGMAKQFFTESEYHNILALSDEKKKKGTFFKYWTFKEAYLKATGEGIGGLEDINFDIPYEAEEFSFIDKFGKQWSCNVIEPSNRYIGAVVVEEDRCMILQKYNV